MSSSLESRPPIYVMDPARATEAAILHAARELLGTHPGQRLTMQAIARSAHISRTGIYSYFTCREALMRRLAEDSVEAIRLALRPYLDREATPHAAIARALRRLVHEVAAHRGVLWLSPEGPPRSAQVCATLSHEIGRDVAVRIAMDRARRDAIAGPSAIVLAETLVATGASVLRRAAWAAADDRGEHLRTLTHVWRATVYGTP